ncbi:MAG TPA: 6-phosphogluconolactonase [Desulfuromonadaceae bacterium]
MIKVYADQHTLSQAAARLFAVEARRAVEDHGCFTVLLAGGSTPRAAYELLARPPLIDVVPWESVHLFWGDERHVPADDPRNNARMARLAFIDQVPVPPAQVHPIPYHSSPRRSAADYEEVLRAFFPEEPPRFDLVFLGLGTNGHTASIFPGTAAVTEHERWVMEVYVAEEELYRITLTAPVINRAALVAFIVAGAEKAPVLKETLDGEMDPGRIPAQLISPENGTLIWLVDRDAASLLRTPEPLTAPGPSK